MRAFLDSGLAWLEELSRYIFVFSTFLGASIAIETGQHPKMTAVTDALHNKPRYAVLFIGNLFCAALSFLVAFYGYQQILRMISTGSMASSVPIPMYVPYLIIPLGMLVAGIRYLYLVICNVKSLAGKAALPDVTTQEGGSAT